VFEKAGQPAFSKKLINFLLKINFFVYFGSLWCTDLKNNFLKIKKLFWCIWFRHEKHFEKQPQPHSQTGKTNVGQA